VPPCSRSAECNASAVVGHQAWWREWDGLPARLRPVAVGWVVAGLAAAGLLTGIFLDGLSFVVLLVVLGFNVGGAIVVLRITRRFTEEGER
jgi:hypothetical protein